MFLSKSEFEELFEASYRVQKVGLYPAVSFSVLSAEFSQILPYKLSYYLDEEDGSEFLHRWYGVADNQLFTLTGFQYDDSIRLSFREKQASEQYQWTFLEKLVDLPKRMLQRITWIRSDFLFKTTNL